ncbi:MAG: sigma-70 family RNA polymerase sigma factor [Planctomycetota bacterium]
MQAAASPGPDAAGDPARWVDEHGDALFRYAMSRLGNRSAAEDLVQETFLAALEARARFRGASAPRTWLIGVLRHKLVDHFRRAGRLDRLEASAALEHEVEGAFDAKGRWKQRPRRWKPQVPGGEMERKEFWQIVEKCVEGVGGRAGEAFALRVLCDLPAQEVCKVLSVEATNLWVLLHRARSGLRACLERSGLGRAGKER